MLNVSQRFKELMKAPVKVVRARIEVEGGTVISAEDNLVSITLESQGQYFLSSARTGKATLLGTSWSSLQKKRLTIYLTAYANADEQEGEEVCYGVYAVRIVEANLEKDMTNIEFDDAITIATNTLYNSTTFVYPMTVAELAKAVAKQSNLKLITDMTTLPNHDYVITEDLWININNSTFRDVIDQIAGATATIARVSGANNNLEFIPVNQAPVDDLGYENLKKFKLGDGYGKVSSIVLARTPQEDNIFVKDESIENSVSPESINRLTGTNDFSGTWENKSDWVQEEQEYLGLTVMSRKGASSGIGQKYYVEKNKKYTFSLYARAEEARDITIYAEVTGSDAEKASCSPNSKVISLTTNWERFSFTVTATENGYLLFRPENTESYETSTYVCGFQVEDGETAHPYTEPVLNGTVEVKLANNEILDDNREAMAQPILEASKGLYYRATELSTEGHGWYEIGDKIDLYENATTYGNKIGTTAITYQKLEITGSFSETLKCTLPEETDTDYATAGSIYGSIWNTEIKVDKQGNEITSIVSRQDQFEDETRENFTQVIQDINGVVTTIQTTGGGNAIHNSVGYNKDTDGTLVGWTSTGTVASETSPESLANGALSGNQIDLGVSSSITQRIAVDSSGSVYTLNFRAKKSVVGQAKVHLRNSIDDYAVNLPNGTGYLWEQFEIVGVKPSESYFDLVVETNNDTDYFAITDLMLTVGDSTTPWVQASDEILSKNVALDSNGVKVSSNTSKDYVKLDELGLNGYSDAEGTMENVFTINRDMTEVSKLRSRKQIEMPPLKVIPINTNGNSGWAFVKIGE